MKRFFKTIPFQSVFVLLLCRSEEHAATTIPTRGYTGKRFSMQGSDASSQFIQHSNIGMPLKGYVVGNDGNVTEHVIAYQEPEKLLAHEFDLAICREANGKKVDVLNPQSEPNFASWVKKDQLSAFYVGDQLFVKGSKNKWYILMSEGAIREIVSLTKVVNNGVTGYAVTEMIQKLDQEPVGVTGLTLSFKNTMSSMTNEHTVLSEKIKKKESGYRLLNLNTVLKEYNTWYNLNYPGQVNYVMPYSYSIPVSTTDELGELFFTSIKDKNYDIIVGLTPSMNDFLATAKSKTTDPEQLKQAEKELKPSMNKIVTDKNKESFFALLNEFATADRSQMQLEKFVFTKNESRSQSSNIDQGQGELHFTANNTPYRIAIKKMFRLNSGWKISEIVLHKTDVISSVEEPAPEEPKEEIAEAPARYDLPEKFSGLLGEWTFVKAIMNGKDVSKEFRQFYIHDQAITLKYLFGGKIIYPVQAETELKITHGYWTYNPNEERDLQIITYMTNGSATERFKIISITDKEFIYMDPKMKTTFYFKR
ncbi:MAG TPA: hypothetical protein DEP18_07350 [Flavobacteriales bacterium]|nr:hypothetical protein [Flavobacteriales bacterium]